MVKILAPLDRAAQELHQPERALGARAPPLQTRLL
jgi:hypothetical protein